MTGDTAALSKVFTFDTDFNLTANLPQPSKSNMRVAFIGYGAAGVATHLQLSRATLETLLANGGDNGKSTLEVIRLNDGPDKRTGEAYHLVDESIADLPAVEQLIAALENPKLLSAVEELNFAMFLEETLLDKSNPSPASGMSIDRMCRPDHFYQFTQDLRAKLLKRDTLCMVAEDIYQGLRKEGLSNSEIEYQAPAAYLIHMLTRLDDQAIGPRDKPPRVLFQMYLQQTERDVLSQNVEINDALGREAVICNDPVDCFITRCARNADGTVRLFAKTDAFQDENGNAINFIDVDAFIDCTGHQKNHGFIPEALRKEPRLVDTGLQLGEIDKALEDCTQFDNSDVTIIGAGPSGIEALGAFRARSFTGKITLIAPSVVGFYCADDRMPLKNYDISGLIAEIQDSEENVSFEGIKDAIIDHLHSEACCNAGQQNFVNALVIGQDELASLLPENDHKAFAKMIGAIVKSGTTQNRYEDFLHYWKETGTLELLQARYEGAEMDSQSGKFILKLKGTNGEIFTRETCIIADAFTMRPTPFGRDGIAYSPFTQSAIEEGFFQIDIDNLRIVPAPGQPCSIAGVARSAQRGFPYSDGFREAGEHIAKCCFDGTGDAAAELEQYIIVEMP